MILQNGSLFLSKGLKFHQYEYLWKGSDPLGKVHCLHHGSPGPAASSVLAHAMLSGEGRGDLQSLAQSLGHRRCLVLNM